MKQILTIALLLAVISLSGCIGDQAQDLYSGRNCGTNITCFNESLVLCEPARVLVTQSYEGNTLSVYSEIKNGTSQNCTVYGKIKEITVAENATSEMQIAAIILKGTDMVCSGNANETLNSLSVEDINKCTGTLADIIKTMMNISSD